ncbi:MAG: hypothetical protein JSS49_14880 [Planctomycetes bacterium]|nr:hypothetical protein [Planctomycetota bacterium]
MDPIDPEVMRLAARLNPSQSVIRFASYRSGIEVDFMAIGQHSTNSRPSRARKHQRASNKLHANPTNECQLEPTWNRKFSSALIGSDFFHGDLAAERIAKDPR